MKETVYGASESILDSEVGLVLKSRTVKAASAKEVGGRKIIKAGTLFANADVVTEFGIIFEDCDVTGMTDAMVSVVMQGRVKASACATEVTAKKEDFAKVGLYLV